MLRYHAQREEVVALGGEDIAKPLAIGDRIFAVAGRRAHRRQQPLRLQKAQLRGGEVRVLVGELGDERPDADEFVGHSWPPPQLMNRKRYLPIWISSPLASIASLVLTELT